MILILVRNSNMLLCHFSIFLCNLLGVIDFFQVCVQSSRCLLWSLFLLAGTLTLAPGPLKLLGSSKGTERARASALHFISLWLGQWCHLLGISPLSIDGSISLVCSLHLASRCSEMTLLPLLHLTRLSEHGGAVPSPPTPQQGARHTTGA